MDAIVDAATLQRIGKIERSASLRRAVKRSLIGLGVAACLTVAANRRRTRTMQPRFDFKAAQAASHAMSAIRTLEEAVQSCGLEQRLIGLVTTRVSQINGCSSSIRSHTREARWNGETEERLYLLHAWREAATPYSERERAALAWTEVLTLMGETDSVYEQVREQLCDEDIAKLTLLVAATNLQTRLAIGFRSATRARGRTPEPCRGVTITSASRDSRATTRTAGPIGSRKDHPAASDP